MGCKSEPEQYRYVDGTLPYGLPYLGHDLGRGRELALNVGTVVHSEVDSAGVPYSGHVPQPT